MENRGNSLAQVELEKLFPLAGRGLVIVRGKREGIQVPFCPSDGSLKRPLAFGTNDRELFLRSRKEPGTEKSPGKRKPVGRTSRQNLKGASRPEKKFAGTRGRRASRGEKKMRQLENRCRFTRGEGWIEEKGTTLSGLHKLDLGAGRQGRGPCVKMTPRGQLGGRRGERRHEKIAHRLEH